MAANQSQRTLSSQSPRQPVSIPVKATLTPLIMTFEIKVSTRPDKQPLKLKVSEVEDKVQTVREFCKTYRITREREEIIRNEVIKYFDARKAEKL